MIRVSRRKNQRLKIKYQKYKSKSRNIRREQRIYHPKREHE